MFTGLDENLNPIVFDYFTATMDAESTEYPYYFTYTDPAGLNIDKIEVEFPEITEEGIN